MIELLQDVTEGPNQTRPRLRRTMKLHSNLHRALEDLHGDLAPGPPFLDPLSADEASIQQLQEELQVERSQVARLVGRLERAEQKAEELVQEQRHEAQDSWEMVHKELETNQEMGGIVERMRGKVLEVSDLFRRKLSWGGQGGKEDQEEGKEEEASGGEAVQEVAEAMF